MELLFNYMYVEASFHKNHDDLMKTLVKH